MAHYITANAKRYFVLLVSLDSRFQSFSSKLQIQFDPFQPLRDPSKAFPRNFFLLQFYLEFIH